MTRSMAEKRQEKLTAVEEEEINPLMRSSHVSLLCHDRPTNTVAMPSYDIWPSANAAIEHHGDWWDNMAMPEHQAIPLHQAKPVPVLPNSTTGYAQQASTPDTPSVNMLHRLEPRLGFDDSRAPSPDRGGQVDVRQQDISSSSTRNSGKARSILGPVELGILSAAEAMALLQR